jgi:hypothetical protein
MSDKKKMPKGGRKGGAVYPRIELKQAVEYARKLVSKTHTGPQPASIVLPGVFSSAATRGKVRASALKQFGLLDGTPKAYKATELAKQISAATPEQLPQLLKESLQKVTVFKTIFTTFCNDTVSVAKIRQQCSQLKIHPDSVNDATDLFVKSACFAGLAKADGDNISFAAHTPEQTGDNGDEEQAGGVDDVKQVEADGGASNDTGITQPDVNQGAKPKGTLPEGKKANIDIRIDPSMDPEKLDKLLTVLKKFGQI